jgi:hypothetical protein
MERLGHRTPIHAAQPVRLRELGYDERWLQDWLATDPTRLGLGQVVVLAQELTHATGGSLDILAADGDTYYSVEVQLGEVDASHGFRVLDYWARNRARYPDKTHVAANAGSNPISMRLQRSDLDKPVVQDLLRASFEILEPGMAPWSERHSSLPDVQGGATHEVGVSVVSDASTNPGA